MKLGARIYNSRWFGGRLVFAIMSAAVSGACVGDVFISPLEEFGVISESRILKDLGRSNSRQAVRADLGGVPVLMPAHFVEDLEYNVDPSQGNQRLDQLPKINSFGFHVRFPDMSGKENVEKWRDYYNSNVFATNWFRVTVVSGDLYAGAESVDRRAKRSLKTMLESETFRPLISYERLGDVEFGLEVFAPKGVNPETGAPYRAHIHAEDIYIAWGDDGKARAFISCSNRNIASAQCVHYFSLEPRMRANVTISYRREFLSQWLDRQVKVAEMIYGFSLNI